MSHQELRALDTETCIEARTRSGKVRMSGEKTGTEGLKTQLAQAQKDLATLGEEVEQLKLAVEQASLEAEHARKLAADEEARVSNLEQELEIQAMKSELTLLRSLEKLRTEHQQIWVQEAKVKDAEQKRTDEWIQDLKDCHQAERQLLLERIASLEHNSNNVASDHDYPFPDDYCDYPTIAGSSDDLLPNGNLDDSPGVTSAGTGVGNVAGTVATTPSATTLVEPSVTATPSTVMFTIAVGSVAAGIDGVAAPALGGHLTTLCDTPLSSTSPVVSTSTSTVTRLSTTAVEFVPTLVSHSVTPPTLTTLSKTVTSPVSSPGVYDSSGVPVPLSTPAAVSGSGGVACVSSRVEDTGVSTSEPMSDSIMETFT